VYPPRPPTVEVAPGLPADVLGPDLVLRGAYSDAAAGVPFDVRVIGSGPRPGQVREFPATTTPGRDPAAGAWQAAVTLFPGTNRLGVVTANRWGTHEAAGPPEVAYRRPPIVESVEPVSATDGGTADVVARVVTDADLGPTGLTVAGRAARPDPPRRLAVVFGLAWWELKAAGVSITSGGAVPDAVEVAAVNADGTGRPVKAVVRQTAPPPTPIERP